MNVESIEELRQLLRDLKIEVHSVDDLTALLRTFRATYSPYAARMRTARLMAIIPPSVSFGVAALVTLIFVAGNSREKVTLQPSDIAGLAIIWGAAALASIVSSVMMMLVLRAGPPAPAPEPEQGASTDPRGTAQPSLRRTAPHETGLHITVLDEPHLTEKSEQP